MIFRDIIDPAAARLHVSEGNAKTGYIPSVSTMPGAGYLSIKSTGATVCDIPGTCAGCCKQCEGECYAVRTVKQYRTAARSWAENTALIRRDPAEFARQLDAYVKQHQPRYMRVHVGGEFMPGKDGMNEFAAWCAVARRNPGTVFYGYTKRAALLMRAQDAGIMPDNLVILLSVWHDTNADARNHAPRFAYDDGTDPAISELPHCPAVDKHGHRTTDGQGQPITCIRCRRCINAKPGDAIAVYAH